ncbi:MAG: response regulator [bacterium]
MSKQLRVLIVEDSEDDTLLLLRELRQGGYDPVFERVERASSMKEALERKRWDIIVSDYVLPSFSGLAALVILKESGLDLPFIMISGKIGEEIAVGAMKAGAHDYLAKSNLKRLVPAVERELREAEVRRERKRAREQLRESEKRLRDLSSKLLVAQEIERRRIARALHDSITASLSALKFRIERMMREWPGPAQAQLRDLVSSVKDMVEETRRIMSDLRPSILDDLGIVPALNWFCREFEKTYSGIAILKQIDVEETDVPDPLRTPIFRIIQEALNNVAKHSKAVSVRLSLSKSDRGIDLSIRDDGQGFHLDPKAPPKESRTGLGLVGMKERAELSGGSMVIQSAIGAGTAVLVSWPDLAK